MTTATNGEARRTLPASASSASGCPFTRPFRVLVVDDDEVEHLLLRLAIEKTGRAIVAEFAHDGSELLTKLEQTPPQRVPDLVMLDLRMPGMDGYTTLARLRESPAWRLLPVLAVSSSSRPLDAERTRLLGADWFHTKPPDFESLVAFVASLPSYRVEQQRSLRHRRTVATTTDRH